MTRSIGHYLPFPGAIPGHGAGRSRITHPFAALTQGRSPGIPLDLHVLSTPPALVLSQNRTLHQKSGEPENRPQKRKTDHPPRGTERTKRIRRPASRPPHWHQKTILSDTINALEFSSHQPDRQPATRPATRRQQEKTIHHTHQNTTPHHTHHTTTQANTTKTPACRKQETLGLSHFERFI